MSAEVLAERGLNPRITKAIYLRVDDARERFDDVVLDFLREFFLQEITDDVPDADSLKPIGLM